MAVFKDIKIEVDFLSKTNTVISTRQFIIYEVIGPGENKPFKLKTYAPSDTRSHDWRILSAN